MNLFRLFDPRSVAVIGASSEAHKVGYAVMRNLLRGGRRRIYAVNPDRRRVLGRRAFASVRDIPAPVDLAVIAVPASVVPGVLEACGRARIPFAVVIAAGFKEIGGEGREREARIVAIAKRYGIALLGPNCLGVIDSRAGLNATFATEEPLSGDIAFVSQSGAMGTAVLDWAAKERIGFSKFVSIGNEAGLTENDFLAHLARDTATKAILMYLEQLSDGRAFMQLAKHIASQKPVVLLKAGRSARGAAAALSHTGSLAPAGEILNAACAQAGVITVDDIRGLFDFAKLFRMGITRPLTRLAVVTNAGGPGVVAADLIDSSRSLTISPLAPSVAAKLRRVLPSFAAVGNPVDLVGDARSDRYNAALRLLAADSGTDGIIAILTPQAMTEPVKTAAVLARCAHRKKIVPVFLGGAAVAKGIDALRGAGLANFDSAGDAIAALDSLAIGRSKTTTEARRPAAPAPRPLPLQKTFTLLRRYGIRVPGTPVRDKRQLGAVLRAFRGVPLAMKVISPTVSHKTDVGGVKLDIRNERDARRAWAEIIKAVATKRPGAKIEGMFLQPMAEGVEVLIGMKRDPTFGPVVVFGLGGIFTEVLKDVSMRIAPVSSVEARAMFREVRGAGILEGVRGQKPKDTGALVKLVVAISRLALENPQVAELDLNPVIVSERGAVVADARLMTLGARGTGSATSG